MPNYRAVARRAAKRYGLDPSIFERQIQQESGFQTGRTSGAGAQGIAQIMPATARGWGVDPNNPKQALDAAAKHMAAYVKQYGSYKNALVAYNAGPGRVGGPLPAETQHYIATILGGKNPKRLGAARGRGGTETTTSTTKLGGPGSAVDVAAALSAQTRPQRTVSGPALPEILTPQGYRPVPISTTPEPQADLKDALSQIAEDKLPSLTTSTSTSRTRATGGSGGGTPKGGSQIKELFWQGPGGIDIKNGKRVPQGFVSGHTDHVHVAAGPKTVVRLGKLAQDMGLHVGENPHFGGVDPVHVAGSYHYRNQAIDVSGDTAKMRKFAKRVAAYQRRRGR